MMEPNVPSDESARLEVLASCRVIDTPPETSFDDVAQLAAQLCDAPIALVSLVTADRQWFKARVGLAIQQTSRKISFCAHALEAAEPLVVPDTLDDVRFRENPLVVGGPNVRFYAGVPLRVADGSAVGTLCVLDRVPRELTPQQLDGLRSLARVVVTELALRRHVAALEATSAASPRLQAGVVVAEQWRLEGLLGRGGVGTVFRATPRDGGAPVAIKFLLPVWKADPEVVARFVREARTLMRLSSPHVVRVLDVGNLEPSAGGLPFIVTELLAGHDLQAVLASRGRIGWGEAASWIADACEGVGEAHALGVVHRDLKPANLFLADADDGSSVVKVIDFGVAKDAAEVAGTKMQVVLGSLQWMSPEQLLSAAKADARSDVWALGAILYELCTGEPAFAGSSEMQLASAVLTGSFQPLRQRLPEAPASLEAVVARCLAADPDARYGDAWELRAALTLLLS